MGLGLIIVFDDHGRKQLSAPSPKVVTMLFADNLCSDSCYIWPPYAISSSIYLSSSSFFPRLISAVTDWMSTNISTHGGPSANSECRSKTCCMRFTGNVGHKNSPKIRHLRTIAQLCQAISLQLRHVLTIRKKLVKQQCLRMSPQYGELRHTND